MSDNRVLAAPRTSSVPARALLALSALGIVVTGLIVRFGLPAFFDSHFVGLLADQLGSVLYTALVFVLIRFVNPRLASVVAALIAFGISVAIELLQLSPVPATLGHYFGPAALVFGTTFNALDLVGYAVGAVLAGFLFGHVGTRALVPSRVK